MEFIGRRRSGGIISDFEGQSKKLLGFVFLLRLRLFCCYEEVQTAPRFKKKDRY